jgi:ABC-type amino acid transport substrate-binding protein
MKNLISSLLFFMMVLIVFLVPCDSRPSQTSKSVLETPSHTVNPKNRVKQELRSTAEGKIRLAVYPKDGKGDAGVGIIQKTVGTAPSQHATYDAKRDEPIKIVYPVVMPPYTFKDDTGRAQGLAVDFLRLWSKKTGIPIRFTSTPWNQGLEMMRDGKADIHASLYYSEKRDAYLDYATVAASSAGSIFFHKNIINIDGPEDLKAYRVGAVRDSYHEQYVQEHLPKGTLASYPEFPEMLTAAQKGDIRVFVEDVGATIYRLKQRGLLHEFRYNPVRPLYRNNFWIAVRQGDTELAQALKQGMALISPKERATIERKWLGTSALKTQDTLFLAMYNDFAPFTFINAEGRPAGLFVDIWQLWAKKTGKKIEFVTGNWKDSLNSLKQGNADIHSGLFYSDARAQWLNYSQPFYETGSCFFYPGKQKERYKQDSYAGKKVGVIKGSYHEEHLRKEYPTVDVILFESIEKMLRAMLNGEISACLTEYSSATDLINRLGLSGMFNADPDILFTKNFYAGVIKGNSELLALVDEGFEAITNHELAGIEEHWVLDPGKRYFKETDGKIHLTESETAWLKAHPDIELAYTDIFEPEVILNPDGSYSGMLVDFLDALNRKLGTDMSLRIDSIPKILEQAKTKEVDGILNIHPEYADSLGLLKTRAHWPGYPTVFARRNAYFESPDDFRGKRVAIIDGVYFSEKMMRQYGKQATILKVDNALEGLRSVAKGDADFFLGASFNSYFITKYQLLDVVPTYIFLDYQEKFGIAIRPDWPQLVSILNKGISSFSEEDIHAIIAKWSYLSKKQDTIELTPEERTWLDQNHTVRVRVADYPPFIIVRKDKKSAGMSMDYLNLIADRTGIKFKYVFETLPRQEALEGLKQRQGPDLIQCMVRTPDRESYISFSNEFIKTSRVIFTRIEGKFVGGIEDLSGLTVAVQGGTVVQQEIERKFPAINLLLFDSDQLALKAVATDRADAYIGNQIVGVYLILQNGWTNLKIAAPASMSDHSFSYGSRKDWPELSSIINKGLDTIAPDEKMAIRNKYLSIRYEHGISGADVLKWVLGVAGGGLGIVFFFLFWNRSLAKQVEERTSELSYSHKLLEAEIVERKQADQALKKYQQRLKSLAAQLTLVEEKERRRIAADLHDQIGQSLVLARMQIASAKKSATDAGLAAKLDDI